jgi:hypothetical protein
MILRYEDNYIWNENNTLNNVWQCPTWRPLVYVDHLFYICDMINEPFKENPQPKCAVKIQGSHPKLAAAAEAFRSVYPHCVAAPNPTVLFAVFNVRT